jgi:accessory gene regulator protein AgrB
MRELNTVVIAPTHIDNNNTVLLYSIKGELRISKYTPAVTIVAA